MIQFLGSISAIFAFPFLGLALFIWMDTDEVFRTYYKLPLIISIPFLTFAAICFAI